MSEKKLSRRKFLKTFGSSAIGLGLAGGLSACSSLSSLTNNQKAAKILPVLEKIAKDKPSVIWFQGASCSGCTISLLNSVHPDIAEVLFKIINLQAHQTLMQSSGAMAIDIFNDAIKNKKDKFILIYEGAVPTAENGRYGTFASTASLDDPNNSNDDTILNWTKKLGNAAKIVISVGTCATFGGIAAAKPNIIKAKPVSEILDKDKPVINIPGCPPNPAWMVDTLIHVLLFGMPKLDKYRRPKVFFNQTIHENCPNYWDFQKQKYAKYLGDEGCLVFLGCKGAITGADCAKRHWNNGVNWCIGSNAPCIGCTQPEFPDKLSPLYAKLPDEILEVRKDI